MSYPRQPACYTSIVVAVPISLIQSNIEVAHNQTRGSRAANETVHHPPKSHPALLRVQAIDDRQVELHTIILNQTPHQLIINPQNIQMHPRTLPGHANLTIVMALIV
ncbi:hypothetical protein RND81_08G082100 [Saponaria officinalis]|uniref:Secreted protein n=1 Tax=Saponaria officinalis TaxID=3572 RepID=A0AAW1J511_SAPOF